MYFENEHDYEAIICLGDFFVYMFLVKTYTKNQNRLKTCTY